MKLVQFALSHVRAEVIELWSGNYRSRIDDDENSTKLPWLIAFCGKNDGI